MRSPTTEKLSAQDEIDDLVREARGKVTGGVHYPNQISKLLRRKYLLQSFGIALYAIFGLCLGKVAIPIRFQAYTFEGVAALVLISAMFMAIFNMLSVVIDHYDKRNNEHIYQRFARFTHILGWVLFVLAIILKVIQI